MLVICAEGNTPALEQLENRTAIPNKPRKDSKILLFFIVFIFKYVGRKDGL